MIRNHMQQAGNVFSECVGHLQDKNILKVARKIDAEYEDYPSLARGITEHFDGHSRKG